MMGPAEGRQAAQLVRIPSGIGARAGGEGLGAVLTVIGGFYLQAVRGPSRR